MPSRDDAMRYAEAAATPLEELRRACDILLLPSGGGEEELRERLRAHLATLDEARPVVCLNPGLISKPAGPRGPRLSRPGSNEHASVFAAEIALVPDVPDFAAMLHTQLDTTRALAATFGEAHAALRPAPDKWSVREVVGHLCDCERVLSYRLLAALRGERATQPGFDHVGWVGAAGFESRPLAQVMAEFVIVRNATVALVAGTEEACFTHRLAVGSGSITGVALAYLIAGHERHHQEVLRLRYLPLLPHV